MGLVTFSVMEEWGSSLVVLVLLEVDLALEVEEVWVI